MLVITLSPPQSNHCGRDQQEQVISLEGFLSTALEEPPQLFLAMGLVPWQSYVALQFPPYLFLYLTFHL
jgi:hypothetical protein